jgi:hypothetical protein
MGFLLRRTRKAVWVGDGRDREAAVREFERSETDTDGLSLFEVETEEQRTMVVAAVACERRNTSRVDLMEVAREELEAYGPVVPTPDKGTTAVPAANALHCSLDWDAATLRRLAESLFDQRRAPREYGAQAVRAAVQSVDPNTLVEDEARAFVVVERARMPGRES